MCNESKHFIGPYFSVLKILNSSSLFLYNLFFILLIIFSLLLWVLIKVLISCFEYRTQKMKEHFITLIALLFPRECIYVYISWIQSYLLQKKYTTLLIVVDTLLNHFVDNLTKRIPSNF